MSLDAGTLGKNNASRDISSETSEIRGSDQDTHSLLKCILIELKKNNFYLSMMNDSIVADIDVL